MNIQVFTLCCHGCGMIYDFYAASLNIPMNIQGPDGNTYGARACESCMRDGKRVNRAYNALMDGTFEEFKKEHWIPLEVVGTDKVKS
jgi:hypothetical protein